MQKNYLFSSDIKFEHKNNFSMILIKPNKISNIDYSNPGYLTKILNSDFITIIETSPENFVYDLESNLLISEFSEVDRDVNKHVIYEEPNYMYEILFLDIKDSQHMISKNENEFGNLINSYGEKIYGNMLILKSNIPCNDTSIKFSNISKNDLFEMIDSRNNSKVVIYEDGEYREEKVKGDIEIFCKNLFDGEYYHKTDTRFLLHDLHIHYCTSKYGKSIIPNIISDKIDIAVFFSMNSGTYRGNITLNEIKKIIELTKYLKTFLPESEWIKDENDIFNRPIIKNKYRVLESAWNKFLNEKNNISNSI